MSDFGKLELKRNLHFLGPSISAPLADFLESALVEHTPHQAQWLIEFGAVYVNHRRQIDKNFSVGAQDLIRVHLNPKRYDLTSIDFKSRIIFETREFMIVDKPSGLPMHPTLDNLRENLVSAFDVPLYVTHRLDVPTSGLVLLAKTKEYQSLFNDLLMKRQVEKRYSALIEKKLEPQELLHFMIDDVKAPKKVFLEKPTEKHWECRLKIHHSTPQAEFFEVEIELLTGRTHQIRAQLSALGCPIIGDEMYGGRPHPHFGLKATSLKFDCPVRGTPYRFPQYNGG